MKSQLSGGAVAGIVVVVLLIIGGVAWAVFRPNAAPVTKPVAATQPSASPQQMYEQMRKANPNMPANMAPPPKAGAH